MATLHTVSHVTAEKCPTDMLITYTCEYITFLYFSYVSISFYFHTSLRIRHPVSSASCELNVFCVTFHMSHVAIITLYTLGKCVFPHAIILSRLSTVLTRDFTRWDKASLCGVGNSTHLRLKINAPYGLWIYRHFFFIFSILKGCIWPINVSSAACVTDLTAYEKTEHNPERE